MKSLRSRNAEWSVLTWSNGLPRYRLGWFCRIGERDFPVIGRLCTEAASRESVVKLAGKEAAVLLTDDGRQVAQLAKIGLPETHLLLVVIQETEDLGV